MGGAPDASHPLAYLSGSPGIGGRLKSAPEDFMVEEIGEGGSVFAIDTEVVRPGAVSGRFVNFILQKRDWSTTSALSEIGKRLHVNHRYFSVAGNKDKVAVTVQLASVSGVSKEAILSLDIRDISINGAWLADDKVRIGALLGNRFAIRVRGALEKEVSVTRVDRIYSGLSGMFPNYFGAQRFGSTRKNTHAIGFKLLKNDFEDAALSYICDSEGEEAGDAKAARDELKATNDFSKALNYFPKHLRLERSMIAYLARKPGDFLGSFKQLPRSMLLMFIHAVQSHVFNLLLSQRISEAKKDHGEKIDLGENPSSPSSPSAVLELERGEYYCSETLGFPDISKTSDAGWVVGKIIGYETPVNEREKKMLSELGIQKESFRLKAIPEIASKGTHRPLLAPLKDFNFDADTDTFRFSLPAGSYATIAMREFLDTDKGDPREMHDP